MIAEFDYYKTFYIVAKCGNITKAAEELCLSQPSVTRAIHNLENQLGCTLFTRSSRGVQLTNEGTILYRRVMPAYLMITAAEEELQRRQGCSGGLLRLAISSTFHAILIMPHIQTFCTQYPNTKIELVAMVAPSDIVESSETVRTAKADFAFGNRSAGLDEADVRCVTLTKSREVIVAGQAFAHLKGKRLSAAELAQHPIILPPHTSTPRSYYEEVFRSAGYPLCPAMEATDPSWSVEAARLGLGITFCREEYAAAGLRSGELIELEVDFPLVQGGGEVAIYFATHRNYSPEARAFLHLLNTEFHLDLPE